MIKDTVFQIRTAHPTDYEAANVLYCAWQNHHHQVLPNVFKPQKNQTFIKRDTFLNLLEDHDSTIIVAAIKQKLVGFIEVVFDNEKAGDDHYAAKRASIEYLYVLPKYRHRGIGKALVEAAAKWAKSKKRDLLIVSTYEANQSAVKLYRHNKFSSQVLRMEREL